MWPPKGVPSGQCPVTGETHIHRLSILHEGPLPLRSPEGVSKLWVSNAPLVRGHSMIRCRPWALPPPHEPVGPDGDDMSPPSLYAGVIDYWPPTNHVAVSPRRSLGQTCWPLAIKIPVRRYYLPGPLITLMACKGRAGIPHCPPPLPSLMSAARPSYDGPLDVASVIHTNSIHC